MNTRNTLNSNKMGKALQMPALCLALTLAAVACSTAPKSAADPGADAANEIDAAIKDTTATSLDDTSPQLYVRLTPFQAGIVSGEISQRSSALRRMTPTGKRLRRP
jgi:hypothetical protein